MTDERKGLPSASEMHRVVKCPGYLALKSEVVTGGSGAGSQPKDVSFGNDVHAILAGNPALAEMNVSERAEWVASMCKRIRNKLEKEIFGDDEILNTFVETRFWLTNPKGDKVFSAQLDYAATNNKGKWVCLDFKSLPGQVDPSSENWQLCSQAVCLADDDETRNAATPTFIDEVFCAIIQPLVTTKPEVVRYTVPELIRAKAMIVAKLEESKVPNAPRIPGPHCKFCPCAAHCPETAADIMALEKQHSLGVSHLTPEMIAAMIPRFAAIEKVIKDVKDRAKSLAAAGQLPGYELKDVAGQRFLPDVQAARDMFKDWVTKEEIVSMLRLPLTKLREKFVERYSTVTKATKVEAGEEFDRLCENIVQRESPQKRLVKI